MTTSATDATLVAALNGAMAHLYVRPADSTSWSNQPTEKEIGVAAEVLRLFLMNGVQFGGTPSVRNYATTANEAFGPVYRARQYQFLQDVGLGRLIGAVDFILVRLNGSYVIYNGLEPDPLGTPTPTPAPADTPSPTPTPTIKIRSLPLSFLESATAAENGRDRYVQLVQRVEEMERSDRSGDIVLVMRDETDNPQQRFTTGVACRGWHAGLNRSDSYVPLILSYPGGNRWALEDLTTLCLSQGERGARDCSQNKVLPEFVKEIFRREYFQ